MIHARTAKRARDIIAIESDRRIGYYIMWTLCCDILQTANFFIQLDKTELGSIEASFEGIAGFCQRKRGVANLLLIETK